MDSLIKRVRLKDNERKCLNGSGSQANTPGNVETKNILQPNPNPNVSDSRENASRDHPQQRESRPSSRTHISKFSIAGLKDELNQGVEACFQKLYNHINMISDSLSTVTSMLATDVGDEMCW